MKPLVVLSDPTIHPEAIALLERHCRLHALAPYSPETAYAEACREASAIVARLGVVTRRTIEAAPQLRIVARHGTGVDAVDVAAATEAGVIVTSAGTANAAAVAEYAFALLLALARKVPQADAGMRAGGWVRETQVGMELEGRTLGIIGLGATGTRMARQAQGFGMRVLAWRSHRPQPSLPGVELMDGPELLAAADIVSLHLRLSAETDGFLDAAAIATMRPGAVLVNTARGELVDEAALIRALESGHLAGAALDAFAAEPLPAESPLRRAPNLVLSPHVAGQTHAALARVGRAAAEAVLAELAGQRPAHVHNAEAYDVRRRRNLFASPVLPIGL